MMFLGRVGNRCASLGASRVGPRKAAVGVALILTVASPAFAQNGGSGEIFSVDPALDLTGTALLIGSAVLVDSEKHDWEGTDPCRSLRRAPTAAERAAYLRLPPDGGLCDASEVPSFDRWATDLNYEWAAPVSDALLYTLIATPLVFSGIDTPASGAPADRLGTDATVTFQALGATYLATVLLKVAVARPRPLTYNAHFDKSKRFSGDARMSFPSGHASMSYAAASVLAVMLAERFGDDPGAVSGIALGYVLATAVAVHRVLGGKHFLTDVVVGAALGTALGLTIPLLHTKTSEPGVGGPTTARSVVGIGGVF